MALSRPDWGREFSWSVVAIIDGGQPVCRRPNAARSHGPAHPHTARGTAPTAYKIGCKKRGNTRASDLVGQENENVKGYAHATRYRDVTGQGALGGLSIGRGQKMMDA